MEKILLETEGNALVYTFSVTKSLFIKLKYSWFRVIVLIASVQQSDSVIYIYILL